MDLDIHIAMVKTLLDPGVVGQYPWKLMGMGKLQLDLTRDIALHIWHKDMKYHNVSMVHDHPWNMKSRVIAGTIFDTTWTDGTVWHPSSFTHAWRIINLEEGPDDVGVNFLTNLSRGLTRPVHAGEQYFLPRHTIHETDAVPGTVTIVEKERDGSRDARVFWPKDKVFGTAKSRRADLSEVMFFAAAANKLLKGWYS